MLAYFSHRYRKSDCHILLFSATMPAPILKIAGDFMGEYDIIDAGDLATTTDAGIVKFMTTTEATAIWVRAWAAATPS